MTHSPIESGELPKNKISDRNLRNVGFSLFREKNRVFFGTDVNFSRFFERMMLGFHQKMHLIRSFFIYFGALSLENANSEKMQRGSRNVG